MPDYEAILYVQTAPTVEPLSTDEAKAVCRKTDNEENDLIDRWVKAGREQVQNWTNRTLLATTYKLTANRFPGTVWDTGRAAKPLLRLPRPPFSTLTSVKYYNAAGTQITMTSADYQIVAHPLGAYLMPAIGTVWPATQTDREEAVEVIWVAGYGAALATAALQRAEVPGSLRDAVGHLVEHEHVVRGVQATGVSVSPNILKARDLCMAFFVPEVAGVKVAA